MAKEQTVTSTPILEVGQVKVYADRWYEVSRKIGARLPHIDPEKLTSGVIYMRGGFKFSATTPSHIVSGNTVLSKFTLVKDRVFDTDPIVKVFDQNLAIRELSKEEYEARASEVRE